MRVRKDWVDFIRAAAIIMVVVQHTVGNATGARMFVSFLTLSAVPAFVVLMGYTKALSICSFYRRKENKGKSILTYTCKAMLPVLCAYLIANVVYMIEEAAGYLEYNLLWNYLLNFGAASGPLYFIRYFVLFSLWAPVLYVALAMMNRIPNIVFRRGCAILFLGAMWFLGYYGNQMVFGSSYLFLYVLGMMPVVMPLHHWERRSVCILGVPLCAGGGIACWHFYQAWYPAMMNGTDYQRTGLDKWFPSLMLNPPCPSVVLWALGVIIVLYTAAKGIERGITHGVGLRRFYSGFCMTGKYSLDVFMWHLLVIHKAGQYIPVLNVVAMENFAAYVLLVDVPAVVIPVAIRVLYNQCKKTAYKVLTED